MLDGLGSSCLFVESSFSELLFQILFMKNTEGVLIWWCKNTWQWMSGWFCRFPALRLSPNLAGCHHPSDPVTRSDYNHSSRVSAYDNVVNNNNHKPVSVCLNGSGNSDNDDALVSTPKRTQLVLCRLLCVVDKNLLLS